jgi:hypothetical protein
MTMIDYVSVESSMIKKVGFDEIHHQLYITFHNDSCYVYFNVPKSIYEALIYAESVGKYFVENIKKVFAYRNVTSLQEKE